jgi:type VI secretion system protein ImpA
MSAGWQRAELLEPITAEHPCGQNLEDSALLASFDGYRLYGRTKPLEAVADSADGAPKTLEDRDERPPDWGEIKEKSLEALRQSKDLRLLAHLSAALLRTDGLSAFTETLRIASQWLEAYWDQTYPLVDGDGVVRRSALNCFADPIAVIDRLRRVPIVSSRQHGTFSLRDIDLATAQIAPNKGETRPDEAQINAAFAALTAEELTTLLQGVAGAAQSLKDIDGKMRREVASEAAPEFEPLSSQLVRIEKVLRAQLAARPGATSGTAGADASAGGAGALAVNISGEIRSREEAVRALEAVANYFRKYEPSSPVPLLCDRAKGLVSRGFLEVLADIAPDAVKQARAAGGLKD